MGSVFTAENAEHAEVYDSRQDLILTFLSDLCDLCGEKMF